MKTHVRTLDEFVQMVSLNELFNLVFQYLKLFDRVALNERGDELFKRNFLKLFQL